MSMQTVALRGTEFIKGSISHPLSPAGQAGAMRAAPASQQDSSLAPASHLCGPPAGMPGIPGGTASPLDWALHAVAAASRQQQRGHAAAPILAPASAPAALPTASASFGGRQSQQQAVQGAAAAAAVHPRNVQQRRAEASSAPAARPPPHPQGESCAAGALICIGSI